MGRWFLHPLLHTRYTLFNKAVVDETTQIAVPKHQAMDLKLKEITWLRLVSLLIWTILVMLKRGITQVIEVIEGRIFDKGGQPLHERVDEESIGEAKLLPPLSDEIVLNRIWPFLHREVNVSLMWRLRRVSRAWKRSVGTTLEWAALEVVRVDSPGYVQYL